MDRMWTKIKDLENQNKLLQEEVDLLRNLRMQHWDPKDLEA